MPKFKEPHNIDLIVRIPKAVKDKLKVEAAEEGYSVLEIVRQAIESYCNKDKLAQRKKINMVSRSIQVMQTDLRELEAAVKELNKL